MKKYIYIYRERERGRETKGVGKEDLFSFGLGSLVPPAVDLDSGVDENWALMVLHSQTAVRIISLLCIKDCRPKATVAAPRPSQRRLRLHSPFQSSLPCEAGNKANAATSQV